MNDTQQVAKFIEAAFAKDEYAIVKVERQSAWNLNPLFSHPAPDGLEYAEDDDYSSQLADGWQVLSGHSGQHGYSGPLMHESEFVGGGLAQYMAETPGYFTTAIVWEERAVSYCAKCDVEGCESPNRIEELEPEPVGWLVLYRPLD